MAEWITVKDAARIRKCTEANIRYLISEGKLEAIKESGKWKVKLDSQGPTQEQQKESLYPAEILSVLKAELQEKNDQIRQLQEQNEKMRQDAADASERHDTILLQMTRQQQLMLEDKTKRWYRRWFRKSAGAGEGSTNT